MRRAAVCALLGLALAFDGCTLISGDVGILWTNRPEFAAYTELFNASQNRYKIVVVYKAQPAESLAEGGKPPDVVIGDQISSMPVVRRFGALDPILNRGQVDPSNFYRNLLRAGRYGGRQLLLPVSFDLPVFLSSAQNPAQEGKTDELTPDQVRRQSADFNKNSSDTFKVLAFSPRWNPDFLSLSAEMMGADFHGTAGGDFAWNDQKLLASVDYLRDWIATVDGGADNDQDFSEKYLYDPVYRLLQSGRILYYYTTLKRYFDIPAEKRSSIRFSWVADDGRIEVPEDILFAGVPRWARNRNPAYAFLSWLFRTDTQAKLLRLTTSERIEVFGIANGVSSLAPVNERVLPRYYPALSGRTPAQDSLDFPKAPPNEWSAIKTEVLLPWMEREILRPTTDQRLDTQLKTWRLQKPLM